MNIRNIAAENLNPAPYNPRIDLKPGDPEYEKLRRAIEEFGYVEPIIWNERTGHIISGHQRYKVLSELGHAEIACVVLDLDEVREKALNIAMNKIGGGWDEEKLADLISDLEAEAFDVTMTGFDMEEVADLLAMSGLPDELDLEQEKPGTKNRLTQWRIGRFAVTVSDDEMAALERLCEKYLKAHGTAVGFIGSLVGDKK